MVVSKEVSPSPIVVTLSVIDGRRKGSVPCRLLDGPKNERLAKEYPWDHRTDAYVACRYLQVQLLTSPLVRCVEGETVSGLPYAASL
jgi:hypothetical protein